MQPVALREQKLLQPLEWEPSQIHSAVLLQLLYSLEWEPEEALISA